MKIVSFINHKGGVGKTTSVLNFGAGLVRLGKKVLLIDLDPQANLTYNVGRSQEEKLNLYGAMKGNYSLPIKETKIKGLDIVCSTLDLSSAELELINEPGRENILKRLIRPIQNNYDYIILDCPPSLGLLSLNALSTSDTCIIPVELSNFSLIGMTRLMEVFKKIQERINPNLSDYRVLRTRIDKRQGVHKELSIYLSDKFEGKVFNTEIRTNSKITESQINQEDIFTYDPSSNGANDYSALCDEFIKL